MSESKSEMNDAASVDQNKNGHAPAAAPNASAESPKIMLMLEPMEAQALDALLEIAIKAGGRQIAQAVMVITAKLNAAQRAAG